MPYASSSDVANICPHLLAGASDFSVSSSPTLTAINAWLSTGCALIETHLASYGYDAIPITSIAYNIALDVNANYAAFRAERSLVSSRVSKMENTRADMFKKDFNELLADLCEMDLSQVGVSRGHKPPSAYTGGISRADKLLTEQDTDRIRPRFSGGQFENPDTIHSDTENSDRQVRRDTSS